MMPGVFTRMKRVTDPLDDKAKARIVGRVTVEQDYGSSGSEHSAQHDDDVTSPNFSELFFGLGVDEAGDSLAENSDTDLDLDLECDPSMYEARDVNVDSIKMILQDQRDAFQNVLITKVLKAVKLFSFLKSNKQIMRRNVMAYLRDCGFNAAICKTKWESCGGLTAGSYEFIDVVRTEYSTRYFVDLDFKSEFEIARPTISYERLLPYIPRVFVGKIEDLKQILKVVSDAAKRSLKSRGLLLPPWRKHRFMQNKWLGPYRRTTNLFLASLSSDSPVNQGHGAVKCRAVGFDATVNGGGICFPRQLVRDDLDGILM